MGLAKSMGPRTKTGAGGEGEGACTDPRGQGQGWTNQAQSMCPTCLSSMEAAQSCGPRGSQGPWGKELRVRRGPVA